MTTRRSMSMYDDSIYASISCENGDISITSLDSIHGVDTLDESGKQVMQTSSRLNVVRNFAKKRIAAKQPKRPAAISISSSTIAISQKMPLPQLSSLNGISKREGIEILSKKATAVTACSGTSKRKYHLISIKKLLTGYDSKEDVDTDQEQDAPYVYRSSLQPIGPPQGPKASEAPIISDKIACDKDQQATEKRAKFGPDAESDVSAPCLKKQH